MNNSSARFTLLLPALSLCLLFGSASAATAHSGYLLVSNYGTLLLISPDGTQHPVASGVNQAVLSPDGSKFAFTTDSQPKLLNSTQKLMIMPVEGGERQQIVELPQGAHFGGIGWRPDGGAIAYDVFSKEKPNELYIAPVSPAKS